jgi:YD repeat-containing protein
VRLSVAADGSLIVHEYGGGAENVFAPVGFTAKDLDQAIVTLAEAARKAGSVPGGPGQFEAYKKKLRDDVSFRNAEWENLLRQRKVTARQFKDGTQFQSVKFTYQYLTKTKEGFVRVFDNGRIERFSDDGKLTRVSDKSGAWLQLSYGKEGRIEKWVDNLNRKAFFTYNNQGLLEKIQGESGKVAEYRYNALAELIYSKDVDGNVYTFKYDPNKRHNLVEIGYADKTKLAIEYYPIEKKENVKQLVDRDGTVTSYGYDTADPAHFTIKVSVQDAKAKPLSSSSYEYFTKKRAAGGEWTYRLVTTLDGDRTDTTYNEAFGLPVSIKREGEETKFEYDGKGRVTRKVTPQETTKLTYDAKHSKVARVDRVPAKGGKARWSEFQYDEKANLVFARDSGGKAVKLFYDPQARIKTMVDQAKKRIDFKYDENSKPIEIIDPQLGSINVTYNNAGEVKNVESKAGRKIAMEVTSQFQNLLDIIRPAGVNLSF